MSSDIHVHVHAGPQVSTSTKTTLAAEETPESAALGRKIARDASGSEKALLRMLQEAGARVLRAYPAPNFGLAPDDRRDLLQVHVRFPDGTMGYFAPGGPPRQWSYRFVEGSRPGDENLPGVDPIDIGRVTGAREEHTPECPCAHRHEGDKTVRPCAGEAGEASRYDFGPKDPEVRAQWTREIEEMLRAGGFVNPEQHAKRLVAEGYGPEEIRYRIATGQIQNQLGIQMMKKGDFGARETAPVIYEAAAGEDVRWDKAPDGSTFAKVNGISYRVRRKGSRWELVNHTDGKSLGTYSTQKDARCAIVKPKAAEAPLVANAVGAATGALVATALAAEEDALGGDCIPWVTVERNAEKYEACVARGKKLGMVATPKAVYEIMAPFYDKTDQEVFCVLIGNIRGELRGVVEVARGQISRVSVGVPEILRPVLIMRGEYMICTHNHPTTIPKPSKADLDLTKAIAEAVRPYASEITFADHVVIGGKGKWYSIREHHPKLFE
jgi:DNA repair protein RadC